MQEKQEDEQLTRFTTPEERENIAGIELEPDDIDHFMDLLRKGLIEAAAIHEGAVQENFGLSVETTISLSRPVKGEDGAVVELEGKERVEGRLRARKVFHDPSRAPSD
jgi:hypothetical protein